MTLLNVVEQSLYDIGVRKMHVYFITLQRTQIYGNTSVVEDQTINFKT